MKRRLDFLKTIAPFNALPESVLLELAEELKEVSYSKDTVIYQQDVTMMKGVDIIAEGSYESFFYDSTGNKRLVEIHEPGFSYGGVSVLLNRRQSLRTVVAKKGTLVYFLHRKDFRVLCKTYEDFFLHFTAEFGKRMQNEEFVHFFKQPASFTDSYIASEQLYSRRIDSVEFRQVVSCPQHTPIYKAAQSMAAQKTSCLFVLNDDKKIIGYVTDITLRDKVIAGQHDTADAVSAVMDSPIVSISADAFVYEALLMMFQTKTRYLLIEKNGDYVGFISRNKLLSEQAQSPLVFIQSVKLALSTDELKRKWESVPQFVTQLLGRGVNAEIVNQIITTVADTIAQKVIESVIADVGQPPAKFVFMVLGSEGRKEQTFKTDQDNAIIYEDKANEHREEVRAYFLEFARQVSANLNHIGFVYCTGDFMAQNPKWTHSLSHWKRNYEYWMDESIPETVINFSTFFDCRVIYGETAIMDELHQFLDEKLQQPLEKLFFHMAKNALQYEPPLTFFNTIRTFKRDSREVFDIKRTMSPIVDLVRVYALKNRIFEVNTGERLKALKAKGIFSESEYHELIQSYYFLMNLRLKKQTEQIIQDHTAPDNYIELLQLSKIERVTLKEIFKIIENFQSKIKVSFTGSLLS
ncbi:MAG: CBS domain-containing protein [Sphingobacteriaceae bacterium]|nr:MAG: CBS domain-containing protein [Sphingobacteriaceae bacterium]